MSDIYFCIHGKLQGEGFIAALADDTIAQSVKDDITRLHLVTEELLHITGHHLMNDVGVPPGPFP